MKIMQLDKLYYKLPDNFKGTLSDDLRDFAEFLETPTPSLPTTGIDMKKDPWGSFTQVVDNGGRFSGVVGLRKLVKGEWKPMKLGV